MSISARSGLVLCLVLALGCSTMPTATVGPIGAASLASSPRVQTWTDLDADETSAHITSAGGAAIFAIEGTLTGSPQVGLEVSYGGGWLPHAAGHCTLSTTLRSCVVTLGVSHVRVRVQGGTGADIVTASLSGPQRGVSPSGPYTGPLFESYAGVFLGRFASAVLHPSATSVEFIRKFGHNASIPAAGFETVWSEGGFYAWPAAATTMTISSSDVDDTAAGAGARTVEVYGYDDDLLELAPITMAMNGQSGVTIGTDLERVHRLIVKTAGASNGNEGTIYVGTGAITLGVPATVYATITPPLSIADGDEENQTQMALWTCPSDASCLVIAVRVFCNNDCTFRMKQREAGGLWRNVLEGDSLSGAASVLGPREMIPLGPGADLECQSQSLSGGPIGVGCQFFALIYRGL